MKRDERLAKERTQQAERVRVRAQRERELVVVQGSVDVLMLGRTVTDRFFERRDELEALYELLAMFEAARAQMLRAVDDFGKTHTRAADSLEAGTFWEGLAQGAGQALDVATVRLKACRDAALVMCRLVQVYVPALYSVHEKAARERRLRFEVKRGAAGWQLLFDGVPAPGSAEVYETAELAWLAFEAVTQ